jgi:hypothetical protein
MNQQSLFYGEPDVFVVIILHFETFSAARVAGLLCAGTVTTVFACT